MPAKSQWFSLSQVHEIEKRALPEWFKTKKAVFGAVVVFKLFRNRTNSKKTNNFTKNIETILLILQEISIFHQPKQEKDLLVMFVLSYEFMHF